MRRLIPVILVAILAIAGWLIFGAKKSSQSNQIGGGGPATDAVLSNPSPADWPMYRRTYNGWGYSPLNKINKDNVASLEFTWSTAIGPGAVESTPVVYQGSLYLPQPNDIIEAFNGKTGDRLWVYSRDLPRDLDSNPSYVQRTTRNIAFYQDKVFHATLDGYVIALEAKTGKLAWESQVADYKQMVQVAGPIIVKGKVITGRACILGVPEGCFIVAHDAVTGKEVWRQSLLPHAPDPTWGNLAAEKRQQSGAWMVASYDSELDLMFWGTGSPLPLPEGVRGSGKSDLGYTNSTLAIKPDTGEISWSFQHLPRDNWGLDHVYERMIVSTEVAPDASAVKWINPKASGGGERKVITGIPGKTGLMWTLDAKTGEFLWARETVSQNVISDINKDNGKPTLNEASIPKVGQITKVCPSNLGGKTWAAGAYSPDQKVIFIPVLNACMDTNVSGNALSTTLRPSPSDGANLGVLEAISVSSGKTLWRHTQVAPLSSVLATAGGILFAGDLNRRFSAFDAQTGESLWDTALSGPVTGTPITYSVEDRQYVAVALGGGTDLEDSLSLTPNLRPGSGGNALFVFSLPEENQ